MDLSSEQLFALRHLAKGRADFLELAHACVSLGAVGWLADRGLARSSDRGPWQGWEITDAGLALLAGVSS
jgi:hypothetical protein